ncbi:hypothetical protein FB45DRAFT_848497 [Roridomyces roridus]|uniref:C2H2-type domain-containing protein n=1 Tax=Roridomyces roridus TaxID=1738132 RepID=A0AAD7AZL1_9AGAR|nr:hypothetical protein FB45DRAFT_848497 [Roridomyces roridus]
MESSSSTSPSPIEVNPAPKRPGRGHFPCLHPTCPRILTSPYTRSVHMSTHLLPRVRKEFICTFDGCAEAFTRRHDRARHEVALHGKECAHTCERCRRFFSSERMLERHACRGRRRDVGM